MPGECCLVKRILEVKNWFIMGIALCMNFRRRIRKFGTRKMGVGWNL